LRHVVSMPSLPFQSAHEKDSLLPFSQTNLLSPSSAPLILIEERQLNVSLLAALSLPLLAALLLMPTFPPFFFTRLPCKHEGSFPPLFGRPFRVLLLRAFVQRPQAPSLPPFVHRCEDIWAISLFLMRLSSPSFRHKALAPCPFLFFSEGNENTSLSFCYSPRSASAYTLSDPLLFPFRPFQIP